MIPANEKSWLPYSCGALYLVQTMATGVPPWVLQQGLGCWNEVRVFLVRDILLIINSLINVLLSVKITLMGPIIYKSPDNCMAWGGVLQLFQAS